MRNSRMIFLLVLAGWALATTAVRADFIPCPEGKMTWGVATPLPDPWTSTDQAGSNPEQLGEMINGKEWIVCRYRPPNASQQQTSLYPAEPITGNMYLYVMRPAFADIDNDKVPCPVQQLTTKIKTSLPSPWTSTTYVWKLSQKKVTTLAGQPIIQCRYNSPIVTSKPGPTSILRMVNPDTGLPLANTPKPKSKFDLTTKFAVTGVYLGASPKLYTGACPAKVKFQGSIAVNGPGDVHYRTVDSAGKKGPVKKMHFAKSGSQPLAFDITVGGAGPGGIGGLAQPAAPAATPGGLSAGATPPGKHWGWYRVEIVSPSDGKTKSPDATYTVQCQTPKPGAIKAVPMVKPAPGGMRGIEHEDIGVR